MFSPRARAALLVVVLACLLAGGIAPARGIPLIEKPWFPVTGAYLGASVARQADDDTPTCRHQDPRLARELFEGVLCSGRPLFLDHQYRKWDASLDGEPWPTDYDRWSRDRGNRLFFSWGSTRVGGKRVMWRDIAAGRYDAEIDAQALAVKEFGAPVYISYHWEPEFSGTSGRFGTAAQYRAAWRRIVDRFRALDVSNVRWILTLMAWTFVPQSGRNPSAYWPGDGYIDAVGVDGYNWYDCLGGSTTWNTAETTFQNAYDWVLARGKPMFLAEWGSVEDPADEERKAAWFEDAETWIMSHPNVKAVTYFHRHDAKEHQNRDCDWTVDTSLGSLLAFRNMVANPYFNP